MGNFIDPHWTSAITIGYNEAIAKNAKKIVEFCEKTISYTVISGDATLQEKLRYF